MNEITRIKEAYAKRDWIYNDNVNDPKIRKWLHTVVGKEDLSRHDKWLCMMYPVCFF